MIILFWVLYFLMFCIIVVVKISEIRKAKAQANTEQKAINTPSMHDRLYNPMYAFLPENIHHNEQMSNDLNSDSTPAIDTNSPDYITDPTYNYMPENIYHDLHENMTNPIHSDMPGNILHDSFENMTNPIHSDMPENIFHSSTNDFMNTGSSSSFNDFNSNNGL